MPVHNTRATNPDHAAKKLWCSKMNYRSNNGQAVYHDSKARRSLRYISRDVDSHNGGYWKTADSIKNLLSKSRRSGTYNIKLIRIGD